MKRIFLSLFLAASAVFLFTQCKKDSSSASTADYSPLTAGSSWTYNYMQNASTPTTFTVTATANDTTVASGRKYTILTSTQGINTYMLKSGNDYYRFVSYPTVGINNHEEHYLSDNQAVGKTWTDTANFIYPGSSIPITAQLLYTIKETGSTHSVAGKSYSNVIHVRLDASITFIGAIGGGDFYYANGIGMIDSNILLTPPGQPSFSSSQLLTSYQIK